MSKRVGQVEDNGIIERGSHCSVVRFELTKRGEEDAEYLRKLNIRTTRAMAPTTR